MKKIKVLLVLFGLLGMPVFAQTSQYAYDANGNLTKDLSKGITKIEYNFLNLPAKVIWTSSKYSEYTYDASGKKLRARHVDGSSVTTLDYCGNMVYENGALKRILVEGGYVEDGEYYFYLQDHLGNNRVVAKADGTVVQMDDYYPFGSTFIRADNDVQPYKFGGKELDRTNGLNLYDFGARQYDARLGRFSTMDPMAEKYYSISPYAYCANNPMRFVDIDGKYIGIPPLGVGANIQSLYLGPRAGEVVSRVAGGESVVNALSNTFIDDGKYALRFATPVEDVRGVVTGTDLFGGNYNRGEAAAWAALSFIPFSKTGKLLKTALKYSDNVADLVKTTGKLSPEAKEIISITKSGNFSDALEVAKDVVGDLGKDATNYVSRAGKETNPFFGKVTGKSSGSKGFRVDFDPNKGGHINWWNGKQKGAIPFNGDFEQVKKIIDNELFK